MTWEDLKPPLSVYKDVIKESGIFVVYFITGKHKNETDDKVIFYDGLTIDLINKKLKFYNKLMVHNYQEFYNYILNEENILNHNILLRFFNEIFKDK